MTHDNNKDSNKFENWIKTSITARMLMVACLTLILLIPLSYINNLIGERSLRQKNVVQEINGKWGNAVLIYGPILKLPYNSYIETKTFNKESKTYTTKISTQLNYAYIFPEHLNTKSNVLSKTLKRGNFESAVFTTDMDFTGNFKKTLLDSKGINAKDILWDKASILVQTSNLKGIKSEVNLKINDNSYVLETNYNDSKNSPLDALETAYILEEDLPKEGEMNFNFSLSFNGSNSIKLIPIGKTTRLEMNSNWPNPSFTGNFLPDDETKEISNNGFKAYWKVLQINRPFSQYYLNSLPNLSSYAFGTKFIVMVDEYQKSERSAKYGFLVIGLTFLVFFLIQTMSKVSIHPFQYLMIGLALTMFYTLLVSISEHSNFLKAYLIAGISVILLISLYSKSILKTLKFPMFIGASLSALYAFIYVIIQLENYALLVGSIGLFLILGILMFISRKIDWDKA